MRYCISDVHGEYGLFRKLLRAIDFKDTDELYVCGDIIDKGQNSVELAKYISSLPNAQCIIGNHELAFLKYYRALLDDLPGDPDAVLDRLQAYFSDGELLDWELVDWIDALPSYIETDEFICVHAGLPLDEDGCPLPLEDAAPEELVNDRRFKEKGVVNKGGKCVFFGHTETSNICGVDKIIGYRRNRRTACTSIMDYHKVHLDVGAWHSGVLGCFCIDTCKVFYVQK